MSVKFYKDDQGNLLGAFIDGAEPPEGAIEVPEPVGDQVWSTSGWVNSGAPVTSLQHKVKKVDFVKTLFYNALISREVAYSLVLNGYSSTNPDPTTCFENEIEWFVLSEVDCTSALFDDVIESLSLDKQTVLTVLGVS
jgi:hypothetical protein